MHTVVRQRAVVLLGALAALALQTMSWAQAEVPDTPSPVGMTLVHYEDTSRANWDDNGPRPLSAVVWYPAPRGTTETAWQVSIFNAGKNAREAPLAASSDKLPLIVISHGTGGSAATMAWLAESLAARGYLVAAVNHHGNTGYEPALRLEGFAVWWDRPKDLSVLIDKLMADPRFGPRINADRIGVAGFSIGGYTALAMVGARISHDQWSAFCITHTADSNCHLPPEAKYSDADLRDMLDHNPRIRDAITHAGESFADPRIKAAFAIAPALGPVLTQASLATIQAPVHIIVGAADDQTIPELNAQAMSAVIPTATLDVLPHVTHYTFLPACTLLGRIFASRYCSDPEGADRMVTHDKVSSTALHFFDATLIGQDRLPRYR